LKDLKICVASQNSEKMLSEYQQRCGMFQGTELGETNDSPRNRKIVIFLLFFAVVIAACAQQFLYTHMTQPADTMFQDRHSTPISALQNSSRN
jgi:hypothetical protein